MNPEHLKKLQESVEAFNRWRSQDSTVIPDLSKADLQSADLRGAKLAGANLQGANLGLAVLEGVQLDGTNLDAAFMHKANLRGATMYAANLRGAIMSNVNLEGAHMDRANLQSTFLYEANLRGAGLERTNLQGASLANANLQGANLSKANLTEANLLGAKVDSKTLFENAITQGCRIYRFTLECLRNYGGLTSGDRMQMKIIDPVLELRTSYSGFMQWIHMIALLLFSGPYVWFLCQQWAEIQFNPPGHGPMLGIALLRYVCNGGTGWREGWNPNWLVIALFLFSLLYNILRAALLYKTKSLEQEEQARQLPVMFAMNERQRWS